jgi:2'-hydroxyisoflavone reductase
MKLLVLGGARFLGRHLVDAALARDHAVTVFTRGRTPLPWRERVTALCGDRDPRNAPGLEALSTGTWDAVVDTSGYVPRVVAASADLLRDRVARYLFVSSISVIEKTDRPGLDETAPVAQLTDGTSEDIAQHYGALKAACETVVTAAFDSHATVVRPGLIVGPHDASDRFGYWVARFLHPSLLGERADRAVVPAPPSMPIQLIDARDLATFMLDLLERDAEGGVFNASSPDGQWTMDDLVAALVGMASRPPAPAWIPDEELVGLGVAPWVGLPLWLPASEPEAAGFMHIDCRKAKRAGLATRTLATTIRDTGEWLVARDKASAWKNTLSAERERAVLAAHDKAALR